jgi:hypothetical protein
MVAAAQVSDENIFQNLFCRGQLGTNLYGQQIACEQAFTWVGAGEIEACPHGLSFWDTCSPTKLIIGELWSHGNMIDIK